MPWHIVELVEEIYELQREMQVYIKHIFREENQLERKIDSIAIERNR